MKLILAQFTSIFAAIGGYSGFIPGANYTLPQIDNRYYESICTKNYYGNLIRNPNIVMVPVNGIYEPFMKVCDNYVTNVKHLEYLLKNNYKEAVKEYKKNDELLNNNLNNQITRELLLDSSDIYYGYEAIDKFVDAMVKNTDELTFSSELYNQMNKVLRKELKNVQDKFKKDKNCVMTLIPLAVTTKTKAIIKVVQDFHSIFNVFFNTYGKLLKNPHNFVMDDLICSNPKYMLHLKNLILDFENIIDVYIYANKIRKGQANVLEHPIKVSIPSNDDFKRILKNNRKKLIKILKKIITKNQKANGLEIAYSYYSIKIDKIKTQHKKNNDKKQLKSHKKNKNLTFDDVEKYEKLQSNANFEEFYNIYEEEKNKNLDDYSVKKNSDSEFVIDKKENNYEVKDNNDYFDDKCKLVLRCMPDNFDDMPCKMLCSKRKQKKTGN